MEGKEVVAPQELVDESRNLGGEDELEQGLEVVSVWPCCRGSSGGAV